ncbi:transcriptional repressor [Candidatus Micrarchaeota archaeon]|nr:transcriptional repressor [Candidatus Micrarchaeota archaeon]
MPKKSRKTRQKEQLEKNISNMADLFSADELLAEARKNGLGVGIATIYRFLKGLSTEHKLHRYRCNNRNVYSKSIRGHGHFTCQKCGKTHHLKITDLGFLSKLVNGKICHFQIDVVGLCKKCSES